MESGSLALQPALIELRPLLQELVDAIQPMAQDRGITVYQVADDAMPTELIADPDRMRQIVSVLLHEALRFPCGAPDTMWLLADGGGESCHREIALRITIRGLGKPIPEATRAVMFPAFDGLAVPAGADGPARPTAGTGLAPAIVRHLTTLMGGQLSCETWSAIDGRTGNDFTLTLPPDLLPSPVPGPLASPTRLNNATLPKASAAAAHTGFCWWGR